MPKIWMAARRHLGLLPSHREVEKGRAKILREFPVFIVQASWLDGPVARFIVAATAPGTQLSRH